MSTERGHFRGGPLEGLLLTFLETAVPMWAAAAASWPAGRLSQETRDTGELLARCSDALLGLDCAYPGPAADRSPAPGVLTIGREQAAQGARTAGAGRADILNAIAKALALGALMPGGVTWLGRHWCVAPHGTCPGVISAVWLPDLASRPMAQDAR